MQQKKKEFILETAGKMFVKYGLRKTNINEIAHFARVAKATIYNYFGSKDNVYLEVLKREANIIIDKLSSAAARETLPGKKLVAFAKAREQYMNKTLNILNLDQNTTEGNMPDVMSIKLDLFEREVNLICSILNEGVNKGIFYIKDVLLTAKTIRHALKGFEQELSNEDNDKNIESNMDEFIKILFSGLKYRKPYNPSAV